MANVFGILTAIVLAISAFIAFKNKKAHENEIANRASEAENLVRTQVRFDTASDTAKRLPLEIDTVNESIAGLTAQETSLKESEADLTNQRGQKSSEIESNKAKLEEIARKTAETGDVKELAAKIRALNADIEDLTTTIADSKATLADVTAQSTQAEAIASARRTEFELMSRGESLSGLNTRIRSIYPGWGFVTLASGNNAGVIANSTLDVVRDGEVIAKLLVTAVEESTASATIIPDSLAEDVTLMIGDQVIPGSRVAASASGRN